MKDELIDSINKLKELAVKKHYYCDDGWYSCPLAEDGCHDESVPKDKCTCTADRHNKEVEEIFDKIKLIMEE